MVHLLLITALLAHEWDMFCKRGTISAFAFRSALVPVASFGSAINFASLLIGLIFIFPLL